MAMRIHRLSKSRFVAGLQCERRLWMLVNRPQDRREPTQAEKHRMEIGTAFGRDVTRLFPGGIEISADHEHPEEALEQTAARLNGEAPAIFEAAFLHHNVLIRADILKRSELNLDAWKLIEVKSSSNSDSSRGANLKKYVSDMAVQLYVLEGAGVSVDSISIAWVNSDYERVGELDWRRLVAFEDQTGAVRARSAKIASELDHFLEMIDRPSMPGAVYGKTKCGVCEFSEFCWSEELEDSVIYIPRISQKMLHELSALGVRRISEVPAEYKLTKSQEPFREALRYPDGKLVRPDRLTQWLEDLEYPIRYLDFETWNPCIPPFGKTRPYAQIPFQYSVHIQHEPGGEPSPREFLASVPGDPRPEFIEHLLADLGETGSIVVHHAEFETRRIRELATFSPPHAVALLSLLSRIEDTEIPFKEYWYLHPDLMGSSSIKVVLPTMAPDLSYEGMEIADGQSASVCFEEMYAGNLSGEAFETARQNLLKYCRMDTLAMVRVVERLRELAG
jgi:CRISPR/Cas system-associated exonuclease Cas4 (RecB family)